jgi:hypothetical protein
LINIDLLVKRAKESFISRRSTSTNFYVGSKAGGTRAPPRRQIGMSERRHSRSRGRPAAYLMIVFLLGLPACASAGRTTEPPATVSSEEATVMPHLRQVGPESQNGEVVLRVGDRLQVTPPDRPGGWRVTEYPADILRLDGGAAAAPSHTFDAGTIGRGRISLAPAGSSSSVADAFTMWIRVMRDNVQPPRP